MNCPACGNAMSEIPVGDVKVDACQGGCGGLWFDSWELIKLDEPAENAGELLLDIPKRAGLQVDRSKPLLCPRHPGIVMTRHYWSVKRQVTVDECPECRGIFLDPGELATIRTEYASEEERRQAAEAYFDEMFGKQLAGVRESTARSRSFAHMFRFICPSWYLEGNRFWGAS